MQFTGRCLNVLAGRVMPGLLGVFGVLGLTLGIVAAQTLEAINEHYLIEARYDKGQAYAGNNLGLKITLKTPASQSVPRDKILKLARYEAPEESNIEIKLVGNPERNTRDSYNQEIYTFQVKIPQGTEPRSYKVKLKFQYEADQTTVDREVDLVVGERMNKKLVITGGDSEPFVAGSRVIYNLNLQNDYRDYTINIHEIRITSVPAGLVRSITLGPIGEVKAEINARTNTISFKPFLSIRPIDKETLPLELEIGSMSTTNWIKGFGDSSKLVFDYEYDDGNERIIALPPQEAAVKIRPSDGTLLGAMFIGVIIGTGLKFYLEYLREKGVINRKGVAVFVGITILVGIVITVIAWAGQIQIIAFKDINLSYDRPVVIFIIGLIGALGGVHFLNNWAKKYLPQESSPPKET
ncbi:MAG: hypothetical protein ND895_18075 [Pyrinomonadaceae bacterium]|nr:hypothetical protein [Pyrinomonadaceae bacterium]